MEKYSLTVLSREAADLLNNMTLHRCPFYKIAEIHLLNTGVNYTSDSLIYECAKELESYSSVVRIELAEKKFNLRNEFGKFRLCVGMDVHMTDPIDTPSIYTLYLGGEELVSIGVSGGWDTDRTYTVFVNNPYYENGLHGFEIRKVKSRNQYIFLKTRSAKIAFNMVNRIVAKMRYPKAKNIW